MLTPVAASTDRRRPLQCESLEELEAHLPQAGNLLGALDLLRQEGHAVGPQHLDLFGELVGTQREDVELDDLRELDQRLDAGPEHEVVQRQRVAVGDQRLGHLDHAAVDAHVLEDLEDDPVGRQGPAEPLGEECIWHVYERPARADELVEADVAERGQQQLRSGRVRVL